VALKMNTLLPLKDLLAKLQTVQEEVIAELGGGTSS